MSANTEPIFSGVPNVGRVKIPTVVACTRSDGTAAAAIGTDMYVAFTSGANGSFVQRIRFIPTASANTNTVATTLRVFLSTVNTGFGTTANVSLLAEISVPIISADNSTNAVNYYEIPLNIAIPSGHYILVTQHVAQTTNVQWQAIVFGGDY